MLKLSGSPALLHPADHFGLMCSRRIDTFLRRHTFWHARWDHNCLIGSWCFMDILLASKSWRGWIFHLQQKDDVSIYSAIYWGIIHQGLGIWHHQTTYHTLRPISITPEKSSILIKGSKQFFIYSREPRSGFFFLEPEIIVKKTQRKPETKLQGHVLLFGSLNKIQDASSTKDIIGRCWNTSSMKDIRGRCRWSYSLSPESWFWSKGTSSVRLKTKD